MSGLPTTPNGYKHAVCAAVLAEHPDWPYSLGLDVASRLYHRWAAAHASLLVEAFAGSGSVPSVTRAA